MHHECIEGFLQVVSGLYHTPSGGGYIHKLEIKFLVYTCWPQT